MDRPLIYPGAIPLETDLLNASKSAYIGLSKLAAAMFGTGTFVSGLVCSQSAVPNMQVSVGAGEIYSLQNIDGTAYSSLAADTTHQILKQGVLLDAVALNCPAPLTAGQSINYLVQAAFSESDTASTVLPYYNASNPSVAWSGAGNSGVAQATTRTNTVSVSVVAGTAATTGSQVTPTPSGSAVGLWVVSVAFGAASITNANISQYASAPFNAIGGAISRANTSTLNKSVAGGANVTLDPVGEASAAIIDLSGALTASISVIVPASADQWIVANNTTGGFTVTVKTAAGTGIVVPQGSAMVLFCDGTNVVSAIPSSGLHSGQCRLVKSGVNLLLSPFNGNKLAINGQMQTIPSAGITITPASLPAKATGFVPTNLSAAAGTYTITTAAAHNLAVGDSGWMALSSAPAGTPLMAMNFTVATVPTGTSFTYVFGGATITSGAASGSGGALIYHYAYMNAGVMAIESVATGHSTDAVTGVEIKTGDATRTLVGMSIGGAFTDTPQLQYVRSWFNRMPIKGYMSIQTARSTTSAVNVETNVADRCQFLLWSGESVHISGSSNCANTTVGATIGFTVGWDGSGGVGISTSMTAHIANYYSIISVYPIPISGLEGFHIVSPFISVTAGTGSYGSGGVSVWS